VNSPTLRAAGCEADPAWFPGGIPDPQEVPRTFSLFSPTDDCPFYKWSWQTFLYVTHADGADGQPRFLKFTTPAELFPQNNPNTVQPLPGKPPIGRVVDRVIQAKSEGFIVDQCGKAVYYGIHVNQRFVDFVKANGFDKDVKTIGTFNMFTPIDSGALEIKSSWKILDTKQDDKCAFFTLDTTIPGLKPVNDPIHPEQNKVDLDYANPQTVTLALVGLHVAGTIFNHREFIWATFEHRKNAPGLLNQKVVGNAPVDAASDYTFYKKGTLRSRCNLNPVQQSEFDQASQKFSQPTQVFRQFAFGHIDDAATGNNEPDPDVKSLNESVQPLLIKAKSVWQNYMLVGAVWLRNSPESFVPGLDFVKESTEDPESAQSILQGEFRLSNSTIETFTQHDIPFVGQPGPSLSNCFRCHNTKFDTQTVNGVQKTLNNKLINVSHVLKNAFFGIP
jgi:hypothetical protein